MSAPEPKSSVTKTSDSKRSKINLVQRDGVLKEQVALETHAFAVWPKKYGFLKDFNKMLIEEANKLYGVSEEEFLAMLHSKKCREKGRPIKETTPFYNLPKSGAVPVTTTAEVGWRSARSECSLEFFGKLYRSPKYTIQPADPDLWLAPKNQKFLYLG